MVSVSLEAANRVVPACSRRAARKLRRATSRLLEKHAAAAAWMTFLEEVEWEDRRHVLGWVLAAKTPPALPAALRAALLVALAEYPACLWLPREFAELAAAVGRGVPLHVVATWSWLRGAGEVWVSLRDCKGPAFPLKREVFGPLIQEWTWRARDLGAAAWRICARTPRLAALLEEPAFVALPEAARAWMTQVCEEHGAGRVDPFAVLAAVRVFDHERIPAWFVAGLPEAEALALLGRWPKLRAVERVGLDLAIQLVEGMSAACGATVALATDAALARIGKAKRNRQMWWETLSLLQELARVLPAVFREGLINRPDLLFACGERLAAYGCVRSRRLMRSLKSHPLFLTPEPLPTGADALVALDRVLCAHRRLAAALPAFSTWDRHFAGEKVLRRQSIEEVGAQMLEGLTAMRLRYLMERVDNELTLFGDAHAGLLRAGIRTGRQPLTRFLRAYSQGRDTRLDHAANRQWLAKRPEFPLNAWLRPLRITLPVEGLGDVTLGVEGDPAELLRVGTYTQTCLAPGACNSANAVALLLDVNKRAVFARNSKGRFLARQIVAVGEGGRLVCHAVYPERSSKALEDFFQLYVEDWAMQMRMSIATSSDDETVAPLTVTRWYDDGLWERYCVAATK